MTDVIATEHFNDRMLERYGFTPSPDDIAEIHRQIVDGSTRRFRPAAKRLRGTGHIIHLRGHQIPVIYLRAKDAKYATPCLMTVLPPGDEDNAATLIEDEVAHLRGEIQRAASAIENGDTDRARFILDKALSGQVLA